MSKKKLVIVFCTIVIVLSAIITVLFVNEKSDTIQKQNNVEDMPDIVSPEEVNDKFINLIYTYDTAERQFYEGAEAYMTEDAYETLVPLQNPEAQDGNPIQMKSELKDFTCYYDLSEGVEIQTITEVHYSLSGMGEFTNMQLLKLALTYKDGWKIAECTPLATIEQ